MAKTPMNSTARKPALRDFALLLLALTVIGYGFFDEMLQIFATMAGISIMFTALGILDHGTIEMEDGEEHFKTVQVWGWHYWWVVPAAIGLLAFIKFSSVYQLEASYALALISAYYFIGKVVAVIIDAG